MARSAFFSVMARSVATRQSTRPEYRDCRAALALTNVGMDRHGLRPRDDESDGLPRPAVAQVPVNRGLRFSLKARMPSW